MRGKTNSYEMAWPHGQLYGSIFTRETDTAGRWTYGIWETIILLISIAIMPAGSTELPALSLFVFLFILLGYFTMGIFGVYRVQEHCTL